MGGAAEAVGGLPRHADGLGGLADEAGIGKRFDEAPLLLLGPAVGARTAPDRHPAIIGGIVPFGRRRALFGGVVVGGEILPGLAAGIG